MHTKEKGGFRLPSLWRLLEVSERLLPLGRRDASLDELTLIGGEPRKGVLQEQASVPVIERMDKLMEVASEDEESHLASELADVADHKTSGGFSGGEVGGLEVALCHKDYRIIQSNLMSTIIYVYICVTWICMCLCGSVLYCVTRGAWECAVMRHAVAM